MIEDNVTDVETEVQQSDQKAGLWKKVKSLGASVGNKIATAATSIQTSLKEHFDEKDLAKKKQDSYNKNCQTFSIVGKSDKKGLPCFIQAVRERDTHELFFRSNEDYFNDLKSHTRLRNLSDHSEIEILEIDKDKSSYYTITVEDISYEIEGIRASYRLYDNSSSSPKTVFIQNNTVTGDNATINQNNIISQDLRTIENEIKNAKVNLFQKSKKEEAIILFENFKICITNKVKDENLFSRFLKVLGSIGLTVAVEVVKALITHTFL